MAVVHNVLHNVLHTSYYENDTMKRNETSKSCP